MQRAGWRPARSRLASAVPPSASTPETPARQKRKAADRRRKKKAKREPKRRRPEGDNPEGESGFPHRRQRPGGSGKHDSRHHIRPRSGQDDEVGHRLMSGLAVTPRVGQPPAPHQRFYGVQVSTTQRLALFPVRRWSAFADVA